MDRVRSFAYRDRLAAFAAGGVVLVALAGSAIGTAVDRADSQDVVSAVVVAFFVGTLAVVGAIVSLAVPGNRVGWLLLAGAASLGVGTGLTEAGLHGVLTHPGSVPGAGYMAAVGPALEAAGWVVTVVAVPVVFPDGHLPGPHRLWVPWCAGAAVCVLFLGIILSPTAQRSRLVHWHSPLGLPVRYSGVADALSLLAVVLSVITVGAAVTGLVHRWRRDGPLVRSQLLLFAVAALPPVIVLVLGIAFNGVPGWVFGLAGLPLPVAVLFATVNLGLYDLRRAAHRTLLWLTMSASVAAIYAIVVGSVALVVPASHSWWPPAAAVLAAVLLLPLHHGLQRAVNRVVYGRWSEEPFDVLASLGEQLEAAADVDGLLEATVQELTFGLDLRDVSVRGMDGTTIAGANTTVTPTVATTVPPLTTVPLHAYGGTVGWLSYRPADRQLSTSEQRLVRDLARQIGGALHARMLRDDLQRTRERLVLAREEERRRLRRDLHDGIGPALAGLTMSAATARSLLPSGADAASRQLQVLGESIRSTVTDVRRIVEGLRPPALDELGLLPACTEAINRLTCDAGLDVTVDARGGLPPLPAALEVATYRIVVEAVTNVVRHARARHCMVCLQVDGTELLLSIVDDGRGLTPSSQPGSGLAIMRERAEELGGTFALTVRHGATCVTDGAPTGPTSDHDDSAGVTVHARLPLPVRSEPGWPSSEPAGSRSASTVPARAVRA